MILVFTIALRKKSRDTCCIVHVGIAAQREDVLEQSSLVSKEGEDFARLGP